MDGEVMEISERLALVEKSMRHYRAALSAVVLVAAAGLVQNWPVRKEKPSEQIVAKSFAVVDDNGMVRASLGTVGDHTTLSLYDKAGKPRAGLGTIGDNATLAIYDKANKMRAALGTVDDEVSLILNDRAEKGRAFLVTTGDGALLRLYDKAEKMRAALGNFDLENTATGSTEHRAASSLVLLNEQGRVLWESP